VRPYPQQQAMDRQTKMKQMERRINGMEAELADAGDKVRFAMEEQNKLVGEKNALINTVKVGAVQVESS
jgi:hypothetical protein